MLGASYSPNSKPRPASAAGLPGEMTHEQTGNSPGDRPVPTAPPPPPRWRFSLWPIALFTVVLLYIFLPGIKISTPVSLSYSQFIADAGAHKIKTVDFGNGASGSNTTATGDLTDGKAYTTVIPGPPTTALSQQLTGDGVKSVTAKPPSSGLGTDLLYWLFLLLPFIIVWWVFRRMSRASGGAAGLQGVLGVGRSRAKVFDAERPETKFSDVAGYEGVKSEIGEVIDFLRNPGRYRRAGAVAPRGLPPPGTDQARRCGRIRSAGSRPARRPAGPDESPDLRSCCPGLEDLAPIRRLGQPRPR
jgi:cell division protease FtsH